jgi:hypothetical protein
MYPYSHYLQDMLLNLIQHLNSQSQKRERELIAENDKLKRRVTLLTKKNAQVEESCQEQVEDLRKMVKRVYEEGEI